MVLLAAFAQLRFGELIASRRKSVNLAKMELRVQLATAEMEDGTQFDGDPKSDAGKRPISLPAGLKGDIELHLDRYAQTGPEGRLFVGPLGGVPRRRNFNRIWQPRSKRPASRPRWIYTFMTCGTPAALGPLRAAPRSRSSWLASATPAPARP